MKVRNHSENGNINEVTTEDINNNCGSENTNESTIHNINGNSKLFSVAEITERLLLCGASALRGNCLAQVSCVVSAAPELPLLPLPKNITRHHTIDIRDTSTQDITSHLHTVADVIHQVEKEGGRTLVHCVAGVSRSASLCIAYLIKYWGLSLREAYHHVRERRPCIRPNSGFFHQLIEFEKHLTGQTTVEMVHNSAAGSIIPDVYEPDYYNTMRYNSRSFGIK